MPLYEGNYFENFLIINLESFINLEYFINLESPVLKPCFTRLFPDFPSIKIIWAPLINKLYLHEIWMKEFSCLHSLVYFIFYTLAILVVQ